MWFLAASLLIQNADAKPTTVGKCSITSGTYITSTLACTCLKASVDGSLWWKGIVDNKDAGLGAIDRVPGTCYDNLAYEASMTYAPLLDRLAVAKQLAAIGHGKAKAEDGSWYPGSPYAPPMVVVLGEEILINDPNGPEEFLPPWFELFGGSLILEYAGPFVDIRDLEGNYLTTIEPGPRNVRSVIGADFNDDEHFDLVITFEDGEVWEAVGPIEIGDWLTEPQL